MQTDIQTFKHWTAASKPNSWLLGLSTSQPDKPLPTGGSQIFLGDPQSHRRSFGLGLHCGSGVQGIFHPQGASQEWKKQHALANRAIVTSLLHPWIGRGVPSHQGFDVQRCSKISRTGGPRPRISRVLTMLIACQEQGSGYQLIFPYFSHQNVRTPEVFLREFILMNWISQDVYGLKKWFYPHLSADSDGCYPPPMPNFSLGKICRIRRRSARGLWGVPIQIANGFLVLSCVQGVEMGHLPLQSLEVRKKTTVA